MGLKQDGRGTQGGSKGQNNKQTGLANSIIRGLCSPEKRSRRVRFEQPEIQQQVGLRRVISQGHHRVAKPGSSLRIFHRPPSVVFPIGSLALPPITKSDTVELSGSPIVQNRDEKNPTVPTEHGEWLAAAPLSVRPKGSCMFARFLPETPSDPGEINNFCQCNQLKKGDEQDSIYSLGKSAKSNRYWRQPVVTLDAQCSSVNTHARLEIVHHDKYE